MFGEWQHKFYFAPVPYSAGSSRKLNFQKAIQSQLKNRWLYSNEIQLEIVLHVDVQTTLESDETADLDNYAKSILDGLKGANGVFIDDTQVQTLTISWLDGYRDPSFTVSIKSSPDEFVLKPQEFYEMPDKLWYPHGRILWSEGKSEQISDLQHYAGLGIMEMMSSIKTRARAKLRVAGANRLEAYQRSKYVTSLARGFHRSRVQDGGFAVHKRKDWQAERESWRAANPNALNEIEEIIESSRKNYSTMIELLAGGIPETDSSI